MKKSLKALLIFPLLTGCEKSVNESLNANNLTPLHGSWNGSWSWEKGSKSSILISADSIKLTNFPLKNIVDSSQSLLNEEFKYSFEKNYGGKAQPCLLVTTTKGRGSFPLYISKESGFWTLKYSFSTDLGQSVTFKKN
ncbi:hypothetical protein [Rubritalea tangerina]|uniref:Lipoprotein n=1 Tax=Rubritalea tangerina TaxID=430798 RepID=A0ABW4ZD15_9BACT